MRITLNLPNQLTLGRLGLCVLFVGVLSLHWDFGGTAALAIFIVASLTDWLDGWLAHRYDMVTDLGKLLDPLADKILVSAAFVGLMDVGQDAPEAFNGPPMWMVVIIISREFLITGLRLVATNRGYVLAADWAGKHKTIFQMLYVLVSLSFLSCLELDFGTDSENFVAWMGFIQESLLWIALILTIFSGFWYFFKNRDLFATEFAAEAEVPPVLYPVTGPSPAPGLSSPNPEADKPLALPPTFPAFKEWQTIVSALGSGQQTLILRKGGIAEGKSGFQIRHQRFWLWPTRFHQQLEKTKPGQGGEFKPGADENEPVTLEFFAEIVAVAYLEDWNIVRRLDPFHIWTEEVIRERFDWKSDSGIHCLLVRVFRNATPQTIPWLPEYSGCKSWIDTATPFDPTTAHPVLSQERFQSLRSELASVVPLFSTL